MPRRFAAGVVVTALIATACSVQPIEDPGLGAGDLTTTVYAADGSVLGEIHAGQDRVPVSFDDLPRHVVDAVVAIEDKRYWVHNGVDARAIARAAVVNIEAGAVLEGGSTITQQYIKNTLLTDEITLERKMREAGLALRLERTLDKEEILERYLNTIYFGRSAYGIGAAARRYFGVDITDVSLAQAALLAGIIQSPTTLEPELAPRAAEARRLTVLDRMADLGWITQAEATAAAAEPLGTLPLDELDRLRSPYFTEEAIRRALANPVLGETPEERFDRLYRGGLEIHTTLDPEAQHAAERAIDDVVPGDGPNAALVAIDPRNGAVVAMVGGEDFYDTDDPVARFNLAILGRRQPGSTIKPFVLASALEQGVPLETLFAGGATVEIGTGPDVWEVTNHDGAVFPPLTLDEATVFSVNTVYARLVDLLGVETVAGFVRGAGLPVTDDVPSLALGSLLVSPLELTAAYTAFANGGIRTEPRFLTRIVDADGTELWASTPTTSATMSPDTASAVTATLRDGVRRGTGRNAKIGRPVAGKTGTTESSHDAWFVGYTGDLVASVWLGYADGSRALVPPHTPFTVTGATWPATIWARFAADALAGASFRELPAPDDDRIAIEIDLDTGARAGAVCPGGSVVTLRLVADAIPSSACRTTLASRVTEALRGVVPDVESLPVDEAVTVLEAGGFRIELSWLDAPGVHPGHIAAQFPAAGDTASGAIRLVVGGPEPGTSVPTLLGESRSRAAYWLENLGARVEVVEAWEPGVDPGTARPRAVWGQSPAPGAPITAVVTLWVNP
ncbi:MAG: transglycosylase domain-containing protein [Acidimicrobiia bacterium]|nr:transglycosylase domain-containing protein [Acidimicrobiia bacterium]